MSRETSIYLDLLRFLAALAVLLSHVCSQSFSGSFLWPCTKLGAPAVIVFFVLSGFVIAHSVSQPGRTARSYVLARTARIYSVVLPALALTVLLDAVGMQADPSVYAGFVPVLSDPWSLPITLCFLNEAWGGFDDVALGSNGPFWSLGYEVPFYVWFGCAWYLRGRARLVLLAITVLVVGPGVLALFPMWLLGLGLRRMGAGLVPTPGIGWMLCAGSLLGAAAIIWCRTASVDLTEHRGVELAADHLLALLFAVHLAGFMAVAPQCAGLLRPIEAPIRWLAGSTFTLYLLHQPVVTCMKALSPWPVESAWFRTGMIAVPIAASLAVASLTERRSHAWRAGLEAGLRRLRRTDAGAVVFEPLLRALR